MNHRAERKRGDDKFRIVLFFLIVPVLQLFTPSTIFADPLVTSSTVDLDKDGTTARTLRRVTQELYHVGAEATVRESFPIYHSRNHSGIVARVQPGSKVLLLACDPSPECKTPKGEVDDYYCDWYLIRSVTGLTGWARLRSF